MRPATARCFQSVAANAAQPTPTLEESVVEETQDQHNWIPARASHLRFYVATPLYYRAPDGHLRLYKPGGKALDDLRVGQHRLPSKLYMRAEDKVGALREAQSGLNAQLAEDLGSGDPKAVRETLVDLVGETLAEPRSGSLGAAPETVGILVRGYADHRSVIRGLVTMSNWDYTTAIHSINMMALTLGYCFHTGYAQEDTNELGLSALLHDVGKSEIPLETLTAARKLTREPFEKIAYSLL